tara:strand:+ start:62 stop:937 length:876 start_codon:yes stop_codon:yes gene_type:complete
LTKNDQFFIDDAENDMGRCLVLTAPWSDDIKSIIEKENISVLRLSQSAGWKGEDISFLTELPNLRGVEVYSWGVKDLSPLKDLRGLEYLGLQCEFTKAPDFSNFTNLKICKLLWRPKAKTVFSCSGLILLNIVNYPSDDLTNIEGMGGLQRLQLTSKKLASLSGIEKLTSLSKLDLADCSKLENLSGVEMCQQLETVELEGCKKIQDISLLGELKNIKNLALTNCGKIWSLQSLSKCRFLENISFVGDTVIEDGTLAPLLDIPQLKKMWFADKKNYSHKRDQVATILSLSK